MSRVPTLVIPPRGALAPLRAMEEYLPAEWQRYIEAKEALEAQQKKMRIPPGGTRWPETDPRYIAPINASRKTALRERRSDLETAWKQLAGALLRSLQSGTLHAYTEPTSSDGQYLRIPIALWRQLTTFRIHKGQILGLRLEPVRLLICHADPGVKEPSRRPGRPAATARELFDVEFRARELSGEQLETAGKEAAAIFCILQKKHPDLVLPQEQTGAKWIRPRMKENE